MVRDRGEGNDGYVEKVREHTARYIQELLEERKTLTGAVGELRADKDRLAAEVRALRDELERGHGERRQLQRQLDEIERENQRFTEQYVRIEQENNNLANLYVASYRLHGTLERAEVLSAIQEIVTNLVGCEELGVFELDRDRGGLSLIASTGIDEERFRWVALDDGPIGQAARTGERYVAGAGVREGVDPPGAVTACIPLTLDGNVVGVIAMFRLLQQKNGLEELDHELFALLATHAATALYCTRLREAAGSHA
jgi:hypothetical protein